MSFLRTHTDVSVYIGRVKARLSSRNPFIGMHLLQTGQTSALLASYPSSAVWNPRGGEYIIAKYSVYLYPTNYNKQRNFRSKIDAMSHLKCVFYLRKFRMYFSSCWLEDGVLTDLEWGVVRVWVREGRVVSVDVEGHGQQLRHDAVMSDQRSQTAVHLQEALTIITIIRLVSWGSKARKLETRPGQQMGHLNHVTHHYSGLRLY